MDIEGGGVENLKLPLGVSMIRIPLFRVEIKGRWCSEALLFCLRHSMHYLYIYIYTYILDSDAVETTVGLSVLSKPPERAALHGYCRTKQVDTSILVPEPKKLSPPHTRANPKP